jgi:hypothetical protein
MFTNEFEYDATVTTILDEEGDLEDVQINIDDHGAFIRQFNENTNKYDLIVFTHQMFQEFLVAMKTTEGTWKAMYREK